MTGIEISTLDTTLAALLVDVVLKATLLLGLALALVQLHRRAPARLRLHLVLVALAGAMLVPVFAALLPGWSLPLLPDPLTRSEPTRDTITAITLAELSDELRPTTVPSLGTLQRVAPTDPIDEASLAHLRPPASPAPWRRLLPSVPLALAIVWGLGTALSLARQRATHRRVRALESEARVELDTAALEALESATRRVGITRAVQLLTSPRVTSPMTWGHRYPVVMLPADHVDWSDERRTVVLHHELVHVQRGDWLVRVLARAACAAYWFHPLAWIALSRLVDEQERACDERVVELGTRPSSYAHHLLALARRDGGSTAIPLPALPMARRPQLEVRLMSILRASRGGHAARRAALSLTTVLLLGTLVPVLATVEPWKQHTLEPRPPAKVPEPAAVQEPAAVEEPAAVQAPRAVEPPASLDEALAELAAVAREIEQIELRLEPYEVRLQELESELEPTEWRLDSFEEELEPFEVRLETIEAQLEPFELQLEAIAGQLEPHEALLDEIESGLEPMEVQLAEMEALLEPYEAELESLQARLEPYEARMQEAEERYRAEAAELERAAAEADSVSRAELERTLEDLRRQLEPFHREMERTHAEMAPVFEEMRRLQDEMKPVHDRMRQVHSEMGPTYDRMREVHEQMKPMFDQMRDLQAEMAPIHEQMRAVHLEMEPVMERLRETHIDMEPVHDRMREVHREMEAVHGEMRRLSERIESGTLAVIQETLRGELAPHGIDAAAIADASRAVREAVHLNLHDNRLRLRGSSTAVEQRIGAALREHGYGISGLEQAIELAADAVLDLDVELDVEVRSAPLE